MPKYTVGQVMEIAKKVFNDNFAEFDFLCTAEIVGCKVVKKYVYLEGVEYGPDGVIQAQCTICVFNTKILEQFFAATGISYDTLKGQKILFNGRLSLHKDRVSMIMDEISTEYALGQLQQSQKQIIAALQKEGILHRNKQTQIGYPSYHLAIISAATSDGLQDFLTIMEDNNMPFTYTLYETTVHGNNARDSVDAALQQIAADMHAGKRYSAICIIRGGGDTAGILRQNDLDIARGICLMPIPVIVAVGHTKDSTVLDEVSYLVANTPSAAAHMFIDYTNAYMHQIHSLVMNIHQAVDRKMQSYRIYTDALLEKVNDAIAASLSSIHKRIQSLRDVIQVYHPHNILDKGYAILRQQQSVLGSEMPLIGEQIEIETASYIMQVTVDSVATKE